MKTSLEECSKRAPRGRGGGKILPERERARAGPATPGDPDTSTAAQDCKDAVSDGSGLQRGFWKLPGLPTLLCGSSHRREMLTSLQPALCTRAAFGAAGRRARVALRAGGACELLLLEATMGSPHPQRSQGPRVRLHRGQRGAALPRLQTAVPLPPPGRCVCHQEGTSRPRGQE